MTMTRTTGLHNTHTRCANKKKQSAGKTSVYQQRQN